jgi:DNA-binding helix-hairpin-helix protein with protein kinase domain
MHELRDAKSVDELRDEGFTEFSILDRFSIVRNFLQSVAYLHDRNILVGDMKLDNILVEKNCDVHIIDAGSFQVQDYACNVCHKEYTERIYTGDQLKRILRSVREEYFPINKIIFEILMLKNPFYSRDNTEIDGDGARTFSYPMDMASIPVQDPRTMPYHMKVWFSLSANMRQYFYYYFTEGKVTYLSDWLRELDVYILSKQQRAKAQQQQ